MFHRPAWEFAPIRVLSVCVMCIVFLCMYSVREFSVKVVYLLMSFYNVQFIHTDPINTGYMFLSR